MHNAKCQDEQCFEIEDRHANAKAQEAADHLARFFCQVERDLRSFDGTNS
jgi:hypothetical protein